MPTVHELTGRIGAELGVSDWMTIDQTMIDRFADLTDDHQYIHVDPEKAAATPYGGTIAHGFLLLSLMPALLKRTKGMEIGGKRMGINYGGNKLRFVSAVRAGSRVRGRFGLVDIFEKSPGQWQQTVAFTLEVEGQSKPALVAEWVSQIFVD